MHSIGYTAFNKIKINNTRKCNISKSMKTAIYQLNSRIGDIKYNTNKIIANINIAKQNGCNLFLVPELAICGYSIKDLLFLPDFYEQITLSMTQFLAIDDIMLLITAPFYDEAHNHYYNSLFIIHNGIIKHRYDKQSLPNYGVFNEKRYFKASDNNIVIIDYCQLKIAFVICEDIWDINTVNQLVARQKITDIDLLCVLNASPFDDTKYETRIQLIQNVAIKLCLTIIYVNCVGAQDELVFDGASFVINERGQLITQLPAFIENLSYYTYNSYQSINDLSSQAQQIQELSSEKPHNQEAQSQQLLNKRLQTQEPLNQELAINIHNYPNHIARIYQALVMSLCDYLANNKFIGVIIGLSGGIDSALTLAIAHDAIGSENIITVMMPSVYTSQISIDDALIMSTQILNVKHHHNIAIDKILQQYQYDINNIVNNDNKISSGNLQARIRGNILMAIANDTNYMVINTSNKSEIAVGYSTMYGDMVGGFAVLKDILKTKVYELAAWRNYQNPIIPQRIIDRRPSAELAHNQYDEDELLPYPVLDKILSHLLYDNLSIDSITQLGFKKDDIMKVFLLLHQSEYKRQISALGPKVTAMHFGNDRCYPICNNFKIL